MDFSCFDWGEATLSGCKSRLSVAEIAMAIWCQVSGMMTEALAPDTSFTNGCDLHPPKPFYH